MQFMRRRFRRRPRHNWTLLFLHVPKTAGSALRASLSQIYPPSEQVFLYEGQGPAPSIHIEDFAGLPTADRQRLRFIAGHFHYGLHADVPRPSRYVTIIRDPIDRIASHYDHYRRVAGLRPDTRAGAEGRAIIDQQMTLEDWGFGLQRLEADNEIVRRIAGRTTVPFGHCTDDMLEEAIKHVDEHFVRVLVQERLAESARLLEKDLRTSIPELDYLNVNRERIPVSSLDPTTVGRLRELNHLDHAFYEAMTERLR